MFTVKVAGIDLEGLERMLSRENLDRAQKILAEQVGADSNEFVPYETGTLHGSMTPKRDAVEWDARNANGQGYAEYVYTMEDRLGNVNWTKAGTGGNWFEKAAAEHLGDWERVVGEAIVEGAM